MLRIHFVNGIQILSMAVFIKYAKYPIIIGIILEFIQGIVNYGNG